MKKFLFNNHGDIDMMTAQNNSTLPLKVEETKEEREFRLIQRQAQAIIASGMFTNVKSIAQATMKIMAGKEIGLPPIASINGIHVITDKNGNTKLIPGANILASKIAQHPTLSYRILKSTNEACEIKFYDSKNKIINEESCIGSSSFTIQEAQEAGLLSKNNWKLWPSDMLFARAISRGARRYCPAIYGGSPVYTPEELGDETIEHDEDGVVTNAKLADYSTETIIEEFKETNVLSEGGI
jgi:hypothetical protein